MRKIDIQLCRLLLAGLLWLAASVLCAQPHGWPCDYGYRPGNTWFYRSTTFQGKVYSERVTRDSMGADGRYWVYVSSSIGEQYWFRIDSACVFDQFSSPDDGFSARMFLAMADSGDWWVVDSISTQTPLHAQVDAIYHPIIFGKQVMSKEVVYYPADQSAASWYFSAEYAEGIGVIRKWRHPNGYDEIVGAIIDGVSYGDVSGVAESPADEVSHVGVRPLPASSCATLDIVAHSEHNVTLEICDLLGRLMLRKQLNDLRDGHNAIPLDVNSLPSSSYMIVVDVGGVRYTTALVIAR